MRIVAFISFFLITIFTASSQAQPANGYMVVKSPLAITALEERVKEAVTKNKMAVVNRASASDNAKTRGVAIKGDVVVVVFRNDFAVRMLASNVDAGIEAPIRLHLVEEADGTSSLRYSKPSAVFEPYSGDDLKKIGTELDVIFDAIVKDVKQ
jgi:uncharacterized protein (DUF302 family)